MESDLGGGGPATGEGGGAPAGVGTREAPPRLTGDGTAATPGLHHEAHNHTRGSRLRDAGAMSTVYNARVLGGCMEAGARGP